MLLQPLSFPESDQPVSVSESNPSRGLEDFSVSPPNFFDSGFVCPGGTLARRRRYLRGHGLFREPQNVGVGHEIEGARFRTVKFVSETRDLFGLEVPDLETVFDSECPQSEEGGSDLPLARGQQSDIRLVQPVATSWPPPSRA